MRRAWLNTTAQETNWSKYIIYDALVGSKAYGLDTPESDEDRRGFYLAPTKSFWSLTKPPEQITAGANDSTYWEAEKFIRLALQANPTVLEILWATDYNMEGIASIIRENRYFFLSKRIKTTYIGYATDQMNRFLKRKERGGDPDWKHLMHCVRILLQGLDLLRYREIMLQVNSAYAVELRGIREGYYPLDKIQMWTTRLVVEMEEMDDWLPDQPNRDGADGLLRMLRELGLART
jgi:predicted nucleotidyltransferase